MATFLQATLDSDKTLHWMNAHEAIMYAMQDIKTSSYSPHKLRKTKTHKTKERRRGQGRTKRDFFYLRWDVKEVDAETSRFMHGSYGVFLFHRTKNITQWRTSKSQRAYLQSRSPQLSQSQPSRHLCLSLSLSPCLSVALAARLCLGASVLVLGFIWCCCLFHVGFFLQGPTQSVMTSLVDHEVVMATEIRVAIWANLWALCRPKCLFQVERVRELMLTATRR